MHESDALSEEDEHSGCGSFSDGDASPGEGEDEHDQHDEWAADEEFQSESQEESQGPAPLPVLPEQLLAEVRFLVHKAASASLAAAKTSEVFKAERSPDDDRRLLALLSRLPAFAAALGELPPRARLAAMAYLIAEHRKPGEDVLSGFRKVVREDPAESPNSASVKASQSKQGGDAVCLLLHGSVVVTVAGSEQDEAEEFEQFLEGVEIAPDALQERLPEPIGSTLRANAGTSSAEVLRLPNQVLEKVAAEEDVREQVRAAARKALRESAPKNRSTHQVIAIRSYLKEHVAIFRRVPIDVVDRLIQQVELLEVPTGQRLVAAGSQPDGVRVLLHGAAATCWPDAPLAALPDGSAAAEIWQPIRCAEAWFCEDDAIGEWELWMRHGSPSMADIVAASEETCEVMFIPRSQYDYLLAAHRGVLVLQRVGLLSVCIRARTEEGAVDEGLGLGCPNSPLLLAQNALIESPKEHSLQHSYDRSRSDCDHSLQHSYDRSRSDCELADGFDADDDGKCHYDHDEEDLIQKHAAVVHQWSHRMVMATLSAISEHRARLHHTGKALPKFKASVPLLDSLSRRARLELIGKARLWRAVRGEVIFEEGEPAPSLLMLLNGEVGLFKKGDQSSGASITSLPEDMVQCLPEMSKQHLWRHGIPRSDEARDWLFQLAADEEHGKSSGNSHHEQVACAVMDVAARRWKALNPAMPGPFEDPDLQQRFLKSALLDIKLLGEEAWWATSEEQRRILTPAGEESHKQKALRFSVLDSSARIGGARAMHRFKPKLEKDPQQEAVFVEFSEIGQLVDYVDDGPLGAGVPGAPSETRHQVHTAVALSASTELLVIDASAVAKLLQSVGKNMYSAVFMTAALRRRRGPERSPKDLYLLTRLLRRHEAFAELECRALRQLSRELRLVDVRKGEAACRQGDAADGFFQVLSGSFSAFSATQGSDLGDLFLQVGKGAAFGEEVLLSQQEVWLSTARADTDAELAWLDADVFREVSKDWSGEVSARRRAVEVASKVALTGRLDELSIQDLETMQPALKACPLFQDLDARDRLEVTKQASVIFVPEGGSVSEPSQYQSEFPPFCIVLKGCTGKYDVGSASACSDSHKCQDDAEDPALAAEAEIEGRRKQELRVKLRELRNLRGSLQELEEKQRWKPLDASLEERLRLHALRKKLAQSLEELGDEANEEDEASETSRAVSKSTDASRLTLASRKTQTHAQVTKDARSSTMSNASATGVGSIGGISKMGFSFLTGIGIPEGEDEDDDVMYDEFHRLDSATMEYAEGDCFGGWALPGEVPAKPAEYRAHDDVILLVIDRPAYDLAMQNCEKRRHEERGQLLKRCLPPGTPDEAIEKLVPFFKEEIRPKGSVLVKEGTITSSLWLITAGCCSCRGSAQGTAPAGGAPGAAGGTAPAAGDEGSAGHAPTQETTAQTAPAQKAAAGRKPAAGGLMTQRDGMELGILEEGQFIGLTSVALQQPEPLTVTTASQEVRFLRADQLSQSRFQAIRSEKLLEALKDLCRVRMGWHEDRVDKILEIPGKVNRRTERTRREMQQARIPLVIDSPFLRRRGQAGLLPGMSSLEAVVKHFGNDVHPESEWIATPQERSFFVHMSLVNAASEERAVLMAKDKETEAKIDAANSAFATVPLANSRFGNYKPLMWKQFQEKHSVNESVVSKPRDSARSPASRGSAAESFAPATPQSANASSSPRHSANSGKPGQSTEVSEEHLYPPTTPKAGASPKHRLSLALPSPSGKSLDGLESPSSSPRQTEIVERKPVFNLTTNSRTFQVSKANIRANERRALKMAAAIVPGEDSTEPMVTAKEDMPSMCGFRSFARQRASFGIAPPDNGRSSPDMPAKRTPTRMLNEPSTEALPTATIDSEMPVASPRQERPALPPIAAPRAPARMLPSQERQMRNKMPKFQPDMNLFVGPKTHRGPRQRRSEGMIRSSIVRANTPRSSEKPSFYIGMTGGGPDRKILQQGSGDAEPRRHQDFDVSTWGWADEDKGSSAADEHQEDWRMKELGWEDNLEDAEWHS
eukprot:gb/GFBE01035465.1/.p1 GENE.gb/GFBE01035465.1/~~gb/GFBE01035465.1/.p1  ORF type:complete len:2025 (+),score=364.34 gb/GFBE01035465.1/:1-6075(+)